MRAVSISIFTMPTDRIQWAFTPTTNFTVPTDKFQWVPTPTAIFTIATNII